MPHGVRRMPGSKTRARTPAATPAVARVAKVAVPGLPAHQLNPVEREVLDLQRSAGNRAVTAAVQRQTGPVVQREAAEAAYRILAAGWQVAGRDIVVVATGHGDQVLFFYRRTGLGDKGVGNAVAPGKWAPFKGFMAQDVESVGEKANPKKAWFNKKPYYTQVGADDPLRGYGNARNQQVGNWLDKQGLEPGKPTKDWQAVEQQMDDVANKFRQSAKGGPGGGGAKAAGTEAKAAGVEAKAVGTEAKAAGVEAKALGVEAKALKAEVAGAEIAVGAARATKVARIGRLLMALALPGPQDVFFLFISAFASIAEAKAKLRADSYATGFALGLAAAVTWISPEDAKEMLMYKVADPSMGERVAGFEGVRERGSNEGVAAGWKFGANLNAEQRKGFRRESLSITGLKEKRRYSLDNYIEMGVSLRPMVVELLAEAARQEQEKEDKMKAEAYQRGIAARRH